MSNRHVVDTQIVIPPFHRSTNRPLRRSVRLHFEQRGNRYFVRAEREGVAASATTMMRIRPAGRIALMEDGTRLKCGPNDLWVAERLICDPRAPSRWVNEGVVATGYTAKGAYLNGHDDALNEVYYA